MERDKAILAESLERLGLTEEVLAWQGTWHARVAAKQRTELYKELRRRGLGYRRIAEVCGASKSVVYYAVNGFVQTKVGGYRWVKADMMKDPIAAVTRVGSHHNGS